MQTTHFLILALVIALVTSLFLITIKALAADRRRQFAAGKTAGRIEGRSARVSEHNALQLADLQTLLEISNTLHVAHQTWCALPNTDAYRARVAVNLKALDKIARRIREEGQAIVIDAPVAQEKAA
jgi:hypothetical protein